MEKALREAKLNTNWVEPDGAHEARTRAAIGAVYEDLPPDFEAFAARVAEAGRRISLAMTLLKLTAPGVPDIYQGDELESLNLVDPDNRRPVDFDLRRRLLASESPPPKLKLIREALGLDELGPYEPIDAGPTVCAFRRGRDVIVAAVVHGRGGRVRLPSEAGESSRAAPRSREIELGEPPLALIQRATS